MAAVQASATGQTGQVNERMHSLFVFVMVTTYGLHAALSNTEDAPSVLGVAAFPVRRGQGAAASLLGAFRAAACWPPAARAASLPVPPSAPA